MLERIERIVHPEAESPTFVLSERDQGTTAFDAVISFRNGASANELQSIWLRNDIDKTAVIQT